MAGTRIEGLKLLKVVDGDTVKVELNAVEESLRLACIDTEESLSGSDKPVTRAGKLASAWARSYFGVSDEGFAQQDVLVDLEFDTEDPVDTALSRHRDNFGRLLCYVHKGGENYNMRAVREGYSPYFPKYGRSRQYHREFLQSEAAAQSEWRLVWNPEINAGGTTRDYERLLNWWRARGATVEEFRNEGIQMGVLSVRLDHAEIVDAAVQNRRITVFCDLQQGISKWPGDGALIYAGSPQHKFNLWIPDRNSLASQAILRLIEQRYAGEGRGYVYVTGTAKAFNGKPEIELADLAQLSDVPQAS